MDYQITKGLVAWEDEHCDEKYIYIDKLNGTEVAVLAHLRSTDNQSIRLRAMEERKTELKNRQ